MKLMKVRKVVRRLAILAIATLFCWHVGATTEGALKVSYSSSAVKWIAPPAGTRIPSTTSGGDVQPFTIECWVKMNRLSGRQQILNQYKNGDPGRGSGAFR